MPRQLILHRHIASPCPGCGSRLNSSAPLYGEPGGPEVGDSLVCAACGELLIFADDLSLRPPTADEIEKLQQHEEQWASIQRARIRIAGH